MTQLNKYRLYCETEQTHVYKWDVVMPTQCPNNAAHNITASNTTIVDSIAENVVKLSADYRDNKTILQSSSDGKLKIDVPTTSFGEISTAEMTPVVQADFIYNINPQSLRTSSSGNASVTHEDNKAMLHACGSNSQIAVSTRRFMKYRPGQGSRIQFTAIYTQGVQGNTQLCGVGTNTNGLFFGYSGTDFGVMKVRESVKGWVPQSEWNVDKCDGTGASGFIIDPTKGNVYRINFQWLGFGALTFSVEDSATGAFMPVHRIKYANMHTETSIGNPSMPIRFEIANTTNDDDIHLCMTSCCAFVEGKVVRLGPRYAVDNEKNISSSNYVNILSVKNSDTFHGRDNFIPAYIKFLNTSCVGSSNVTVSLIRGATLDNSNSWYSLESNISTMQVNCEAQIISGGVCKFTYAMSAADSKVIDLDKYMLYIDPGETFTIAAKSSDVSSVAASLAWVEDM